jgi:hypothetical protein
VDQQVTFVVVVIVILLNRVCKVSMNGAMVKIPWRRKKNMRDLCAFFHSIFVGLV